ncbi:hypothetical protein BgiMline_023648 [Biomphalaria glabrata]|nr:hypothetical protein BgiMline_006891 [Biomphalaria glabrata]
METVLTNRNPENPSSAWTRRSGSSRQERPVRGSERNPRVGQGCCSCYSGTATEEKTQHDVAKSEPRFKTRASKENDLVEKEFARPVRTYSNILKLPLAAGDLDPMTFQASAVK